MKVLSIKRIAAVGITLLGIQAYCVIQTALSAQASFIPPVGDEAPKETAGAATRVNSKLKNFVPNEDTRECPENQRCSPGGGR